MKQKTLCGKTIPRSLVSVPAIATAERGFWERMRKKGSAAISATVALIPPQQAQKQVQQQTESEVSTMEKDATFRQREKRTRRLQALLPPSLFDELSRKAQEKNTSITEILIYALRVYLSKI